MESILVTGGSGFIGAALVKSLVDKGFRVRTLDNGFRGAWSRLEKYRSRIECLEGDIRDAALVSQALKDVQTVFHLAYINGTRFFYETPHLVLEVAVKGIVNVLDGMIHHKTPKLVLFSSSEVYQTPPTLPTPESVRLIVPDPYNPRHSYGGGKILSEIMAIHYARHYGFRCKIIRPHNIYGPDMGWEHVIPSFIRRFSDLQKQKSRDTVDFPIQGDGSETRSFCYIDDAVEGTLLASRDGSEDGIYNVGNDEIVSIAELAERMAGRFQMKIRIRPGKRQEGGTTQRCPDLSKLRKLGYKPKILLEEGLKRTCEWYLQHGNIPEGTSG